MDEYVVDMQGFMLPGKSCAVKELAILSINRNEEPLVRLFKPPFPWRRLTEKYKRDNLWLELYYHGLTWNSGDLKYTEHCKIIKETLKDATKIFVCSDLKKEWLSQYGFKAYDLNEWGYFPSENLRSVTICTNHNGRYKSTCAHHNVKFMKQFYIESQCMDWEETDEIIEEFK